MKFLPRLGWMVCALLLAACQKQPEGAAGVTIEPPAKSETVAVVKETERSKNFAAVNRHLELGGTLYGYVDIEGDVLKLTESLQSVVAEFAKTEPNAAMLARQNLSEIAKMLGLTDVKALGISSVPDGGGFFRNRLFLYTAGERHGLMAAMGGKPAAFKHVGLAPTDATFYGESEMDLGVFYKTLKGVVEKVAGEPAGNQLETALKKAGEAATLSLLDLIYGLKGRTAVVMRMDAERTMRLPGRDGLVLPAMSILACVEGVGQIVEPSLAKVRELRRSESGTMHIYEPTRPPPISGIKPAIAIDGTTLFVTTSIEFLKECREQKSGLAQTAEFQKALEQVGKDGNGLTYISPRFFEQVRRVETLNADAPAQMKSVLKLALSRVPSSDRALVSVRTNLDDGILVRSYFNRSLKQEVMMAGIYNPVTAGLLAAMAIPAFQKVRMASQQKAVLNNLRQLAAAADQHYLETGTTTATYSDLVGPTRYVKAINAVAGEDYRQLRFALGRPLVLRMPDGRIIQYPMAQPQMGTQPQPRPGKQ